jgi:hypothetical protein
MGRTTTSRRLLRRRSPWPLDWGCRTWPTLGGCPWPSRGDRDIARTGPNRPAGRAVLSQARPTPRHARGAVPREPAQARGPDGQVGDVGATREHVEQAARGDRPGSTSRPPSPTTSGGAHRAATAGTPAAMPSNAGSPNPSYVDGTTIALAAATRPGTSGSGSRPRRRAPGIPEKRASRRGCGGPARASVRSGCSRRTSGQACARASRFLRVAAPRRAAERAVSPRPASTRSVPRRRRERRSAVGHDDRVADSQQVMCLAGREPDTQITAAARRNSAATDGPETTRRRTARRRHRAV